MTDELANAGDEAPAAADGSEERLDRRRRRIRDAILTFLLLVLLVCIVDMIVVRGPGTREAIARNIGCLRCHTEVLAELRLESRHDPFAEELCTSCHVEHGRKVERRRLAGDFSAWSWLQQTLDGLYLDILWRVFSEWWVVPETQAESTVSSAMGPGGEGGLRLPEERLCWTCHPRLAPQLRMEHTHDPFEEGRCTSCHHPHASRHRVLLRDEERELCVACHHIAEELADPELHRPFEQRSCTSCHEPHASDWSGMLVSKQRELCFGCHRDIEALQAEAVQHEPFETGECTGCHRPHSAEAGPLLVEARPELCYGCHPPIRSEFGRVSAHPVSRIGCQGCHLPHASDFRSVLVESQPGLCFGCHPAIADLRVRFFQHDPFAEDDCTAGCHVPHGSGAAPLLQAPDPALCYRCHPGTADDFRQTSAHPVGKRLKCVGCHEEHASEYRPLLVSTGKKLCYRCHGSVKRYYEADSHKPLACLKCHKAHGSPYVPILLRPNPEVCLRCHVHYADRPHYHVTRPTYWDWHAKKPLTCSSTCHDPHGSPNSRMLRRPYGERGFGTDNACVVCHDDIGVEF